LPGKPLADLGGIPLVVRVLRNSGRASSLDRCLVATDDERIADAVRAAGGGAVMTPAGLPSGSDRVARAVDAVEAEGFRYDVVVNIQGDEPFLPPEAVNAAVTALEMHAEARIATLAVPLPSEDRVRPQVVKVLLDKAGRARDFTREDPGPGALKHLGVYAYRRDYLERFIGLPVAPREAAERLEQLRALADGAVIAVAVGGWPAFGIDTPEDLEAARKLLTL